MRTPLEQTRIKSGRRRTFIVGFGDGVTSERAFLPLSPDHGKSRETDVTPIDAGDNTDVAIPLSQREADQKGCLRVFRSRARDGHNIFEILVREHADMLTAYLRSSLDNTADVDDLFQETMVVAWRRLDDYDRTKPFGPWLRGIAKKLVLAHYRKRASAPTWCTPEVLDALDTRFDTLAAGVGDTFHDRIDALLDCVQRLSDRLRQVIELAYGRGLSLREVAVAIDEHEDAVRKRAQRARSQLYDCLQNAGAQQ